MLVYRIVPSFWSEESCAIECISDERLMHVMMKFQMFGQSGK